MSARIGVAVMAVLLALYIAVVGWRAVQLVLTGEPVGIAMGVALVVLPLIAAWALGRELWFGVRAEQLAKRLEQEGGLPDDEVETLPSGRATRAAAEGLFPRYRDEVERSPDDWRAWFRLSMVYDAAGDRRRARQAAREAIQRERGTR
ncbi:hypothetical protein [Microbacterium rhizophilus]|uniref:hypothetical protein n=1 Tax=Microbacterium rhizophilus TaxID=3138934 RepID=UPI0031E8AA49